MRQSYIELIVFVVFVCLLCSAPLAVHALDYSHARAVRVSLVQGDVQMTQASGQGAEKAVINLPVRHGDAVAVGNGGRVEIEFEDGSTAQIAENSSLEFTELALSEGGRITRLTLTQGTASFYSKPSKQDTFAVLTPNFQVSVSGSARFRIDIASDQSAVSVFKGDVQVNSAAGTRRVEKGTTLSWNSNHPNDFDIQASASQDAWDHWVGDREGVMDVQRDTTLRYTQAPFSYGLSDLAACGNWTYYSGYGYGWQPFGLGAGWMPFLQGYWGFFPGWGWTWISYEPWGWAPYHFGRWGFIPGYGWAWFPGYYNYWSPAPVYWVQTRTGLGWAPLPPKTSAGQVPPVKKHTPVVTGTLDGLKKRVQVVDFSGDAHVQAHAIPPDANGRFADSGASGAGAQAKSTTKGPAGSSAVAAGANGSVPMVSSLRAMRERAQLEERGVSDTLLYLAPKKGAKAGANPAPSPAKAPATNAPPVRQETPRPATPAPAPSHPSPAPSKPHMGMSAVSSPARIEIPRPALSTPMPPAPASTPASATAGRPH